MEIMGNGVFQKCSGTLNLNLAPAFRSKHDHIALHSDKLKPLNKNEAGVACSTLVLANVARQRDMTQVLSSARQQEDAGVKKQLWKSKSQLIMDFWNNIWM